MQKQIKVWDPLVRIFHWSLVTFFVIAYITGEDESSLHIQAGYVILGLIIFRVLWGFIGTQYARFSQFVAGPKKTIDYAKSMVAGKPAHYTGHNPLGGWMVMALLVMLFVVTLSGLKLYAVEEGEGPFAANVPIELISTANADNDEHEADEDSHESGNEHKVNEADEEFWEEIHEVATNLMILLIILHVGGVIYSSRVHNENLVKAMVTGKKLLDE